MIKYLVADLGYSTGEADAGVACKIKYDQLADLLEKDAKKSKNFVYVCNDGDEFELNDARAARVFEALKLTGINLEEMTILDNRTKQAAAESVKNADIIFLAGGKIFCQLDFYNSIRFKDLLKNFDGILIGQSAGAMNIAGKGYVYPEDEEELSLPKIFDGLGLTDINVVPHFDRKRGNDYCSPSLHILKVYREDSKNLGLNLLCLPNGSFVRIDEEGAKVFGEAYEVRGGRICALTAAQRQNYHAKKPAKRSSKKPL